MLGAGFQAADEFRRILDRRGSDPFSPFHAVAWVGLARAHASTGNVAQSLQAYERFLEDWKDADPDVPVLLKAREDYETLKGSAISAGRPY
jgi:hypothetical protein